MKTDFYRNKRSKEFSIEPLAIKIEKRTKGSFSGIAQTLINIGVYFLLFFFFFKDNMRYMGFFIVFMLASVIAQIVIRLAGRIKRTSSFPFFCYVSGKKSYSNYLDHVNSQIDKYISTYSSILKYNNFSTKEAVFVVNSLDAKLWQRLQTHSDFLSINLGEGYPSIPILITYPNLTYDENEKILEKYRSIFQAKIDNKDKYRLPILYSLRNEKSIALVNNMLSDDQFCNILYSIIIDIAVSQSPEDLCICSVFSGEIPIECIRFLPHVWYNHRRLLYNGEEKDSQFFGFLKDALSDTSKQFVAIVDVDFITNDERNDLYSFFNADILPSNLSVIFFSMQGRTPSRASNKVTYWKDNVRILGQIENYVFIPNLLNYDECESVAKRMYSIKLIDNKYHSKGSIPDSISFFELLGVSSAASLPKATDLIEKDGSFSLPIGVSENGNIETIYISNNGDGNHCLITGTNGSGKSEFIIIYLLNACTRFSPEYFNFIVIDFKSGAMSEEVKMFPHCVGEFTNSGNAVTKRQVARVMTMLRSEFDNRVKLCQESGCHGIFEYQEKYSKGLVAIPMPVLLVVVDEVAVLFKEDKEAANYITHIATTGRQYGVHLMLATQSKTSVIPPQVKTNVNITVEFYSDDSGSRNSTEKIKGRALINSFLKRNCTCQVALSHTEPSNVETIDFLTLSAKSRILKKSQPSTQFEQISREIMRRYPAEQYDDIIHQVLKAPLEATFAQEPLLLEELLYEFNERADEQNGVVPIGLSDDIYNRSRCFFELGRTMGNTVVYGQAQSGKTTFIKTMLMSFSNRSCGFTPEEIYFYIIADNIKEYDSYYLPHIGSIFSTDFDSLYYALLYMDREIERRKNAQDDLFIPIILIIDSASWVFSQNGTMQKENILIQKMLENVSSKCEKYNISILFTINHKLSFVPGVLNNFNNVIAFFMGDTFDYSSLSINHNVIKNFPSFPGRCFVQIKGNRTLETQIALPSSEQEECISIVYDWRQLWTGKRLPPPIPTMPQMIKMIYKKPNRILMGLQRDLNESFWNLDYQRCYLLSYFYEKDKNTVISALAHIAINAGFNVIIIDNRKQGMIKYRGYPGTMYFHYDNKDGIEHYLTQLSTEQFFEKTMLIMNDFSKTLFPTGGLNEWKEITRLIVELLKCDDKPFYGFFADEKESINSGRGASYKLVQYLEGASSGLLIGNVPNKHTFGASGLSYFDQDVPLPTGWAINVQETCSKIKLITEV